MKKDTVKKIGNVIGAVVGFGTFTSLRRINKAVCPEVSFTPANAAIGVTCVVIGAGVGFAANLIARVALQMYDDKKHPEEEEEEKEEKKSDPFDEEFEAKDSDIWKEVLGEEEDIVDEEKASDGDFEEIDLRTAPKTVATFSTSITSIDWLRERTDEIGKKMDDLGKMLNNIVKKEPVKAEDEGDDENGE